MTGLCTQCGTKLHPDSISEWWCSDTCQQAWQRKGHDVMPLPARPEWRMGTRTKAERAADWPDLTAAPWVVRRAARDQAAAASAADYPVDAPPASTHQNIIRRILNRKAST